MKRNKTTNRANGGGTSPYQKYGKSPYRYSEKYQDWRRRAMRGEAASQRSEA